jgi:hypothetical protein
MGILKKILLLLSILLVIAGAFALRVYYVATPTAFAEADETSFTARRLADNPIITHEMDKSLMAEYELYGYANINGPAMIKVPEWVDNPLGRYYLYFSHHKGDYIKPAYADQPEGPWRI